MNDKIELIHKPESGELLTVAEHNLHQLNGAMNQLLLHESIGGNSSKAEIDGKFYSCAGANGFLDPITGKILAFTNDSQAEAGVSEQDVHFIMKVAVDFDTGAQQQPRTPRGFFRIVEFRPDEKLSQAPQQNVISAVEQYNQQHANADIE